MSSRSIYLFLSAFVFVLAGASADSAAQTPLRLLFIGNSFTQGGPIPNMVANMAQSAGYPRPTAINAAVGGMTLEWHRTNADTLAWVDQGNWDYVILQEYSTRPTDSNISNANPLRFKQDAAWFYDRVKATSPNAIVVLYETWARHEGNSVYPTYYADRDAMQDQLNFHYHDAAENYMPANVSYSVKDDILLAPCGEGWHINYYNDNVMLHGSDLYHAGPRGYYLNSLIIFSTIYDCSVIGLPVQGVTAQEAAYLQEISESVTKRIPGDYNKDGIVDLADYTVWADHYSQAGQDVLGDGNQDGLVDLADYTVWADNFGRGFQPLTGNRPPRVYAGSDIILYQPAVSTSLNAIVSDDGLPGGTLTTQWTKVSGPGTVTFGNASAVKTTATLSALGQYVLRLTASDGEKTHYDEVVVNYYAQPVNQPPVVNAGADVTSAQKTIILSGSYTDDGFPIPPGAVTVQWSKVSGPGTVTFMNAASTISMTSFSTSGVYVLRLTANDGQATSYDEVTVTIQ